MQKWNILAEFNEKEDIVDLLLENRGISTKEEKREFLNPPTLAEHYQKLPQDFKNSLKKAKKIIDAEIKKETPIIIYGDYDSDGVNATAILYKTIKDELKYQNITYFIPNRFEHGYGLSKDAVDSIFSNDTKRLVITVDTGITAVEEVDYIKKLGHKIIITDHHQPSDTLPKADCILWSDQMVGATVSWFLAKILGSKNTQLLAYAALATITDLYPVMGLNRSIVKAGLKVLNTRPPMGLKKLLQVAGRSKNEVSTYELGWVLGPRLNASGRLVEAEDSLKLLIEEDEKIAEDYAQKLNQINIERQDKTLEMYELASDFDEDNLPRVIVSSNTDYHEGIIGLVAGRLSQKYYRPSIVISLGGKIGKGSVRSVKGVNIIEFLRKFEDLFEDLGGHPMAAGFSISKENVKLLQEKVSEEAENYIKDEDLIPVLDIDLKLPIKEANIGLIHDLEKLKPFGLGNRQPVFLSEDVPVSDINIVGRDSQHLTLKFFKDGSYYKGIMFGGALREKEIEVGDKLDIVYSLNKNEYNGKTYVDLFIKDFGTKK